jgi:ATP-dependent helicase/nuclease subunit A
VNVSGKAIDLDWTALQQARASDPAASSWVAANAGSGKTHVLSQRVIRLLLNGARPSSILCLTYTKAAASEMSNRVFARLSAWTTATDADLSKALHELEGAWPDERRLAFARQLFAVALETPGGLKIQTIHAFCEAVLHQFPLEANVAGHFAVMDDGETATLLAEARRTLLSATTMDEDAELAGAFEEVLAAAGEQGLEVLLDDLVRNRNAIAAFRRSAAARGGVERVLRQALGLAPSDDAATISSEIWPLPVFDAPALAQLGSAVAAVGKDTDRKFHAGLAAVASLCPDERVSHLRQLFMTQAGDPRKVSGLVTKGVLNALPDLDLRISAAQDHVVRVLDRIHIHRMFAATQAALTLATRLNADYERLKRQRGRLDFDDLVERTASLLQRSGASAWVHYKLDQGIDHILVDEAQDTGPAQWEIIRALSSEFFVGAGTRPSVRTLFSVGDEKQSIYSFQGARPERFREEGRVASRRAEASGLPFESVELKLSFRSTEDVLQAVDKVFADPENRRGLSATESGVEHASVRIREPGIVDVWPLIGRDKRIEDEDWTAPFDDTPENDPKAQLARRVAAEIRRLIGSEYRIVKGRRRLLTAGDIIVLVRKRDGFVNALNRELKLEPAVAVAGADRLVLTDHIAIKDLMALGRCLALPDDDLALASVLKSPLFGLLEDDLFTLAADRPAGRSVRDYLRDLARTGRPPFLRAHERLERWGALMASRPVYEFYAEILGPEGGRAEFLARLGSEAADVLDEFLAFALAHEAGGLPGLVSFLEVLAAQSPEIKRELGQAENEVRIMTVHASKGLEAPVVFLVDSGGAAALVQHIPKLRTLPVDGVGEVPLWVPGKSHENSVSLDLRRRLMELAEDEYRRLLYVGMTRAADRLVVCGYHGLNPPRGPHWFDMVSRSLKAHGAAETMFAAGALSWEGWRFTVPGSKPIDGFPFEYELESPSEGEATGMIRPFGPMPAPVLPPRPLVPSGARAVIDPEAGLSSAGSPLAASARGSPNDALERGRLIHRLLQVLPGMALDDREAAARRYLDRTVPSWTNEVRLQTYALVAAILADPAFSAVFAAGSEAEVSVMGTVSLDGRDHVVSGRIDRIAVSDTEVLIIDYKTNRPPIETLDDVPFGYRAQMALYRALLAPLYPGRSIRAGLLFTEAPKLIALPTEVLEAALADIAPK